MTSAQDERTGTGGKGSGDERNELAVRSDKTRERQRGSEGARERGRERGSEGGSEGARERGRERGSEGGRE
eukprot:765877-Hanusia_phi.AAC.2